MSAVASHNFRPFGPTQDGTKLEARSLIESARGAAGRFAKPVKTEHEKLTDKTRTWVSQTFFGTLLKQMRDSPFKSELFGGGQGGQAFSQLYDQHLAEHMARGAGRKLVDGMVRRIEANAAYRKTGTAKQSQRQQPLKQAHERQYGKPKHQANDVATTLRA
jgi:Rod binding domain-containing protein